MFIKVFDEAIVGEVNPNVNVIPVANISFDKDDMQKMIQDELKKFQIENNLIQKQFYSKAEQPNFPNKSNKKYFFLMVLADVLIPQDFTTK